LILPKSNHLCPNFTSILPKSNQIFPNLNNFAQQIFDRGAVVTVVTSKIRTRSWISWLVMRFRGNFVAVVLQERGLMIELALVWRHLSFFSLARSQMQVRSSKQFLCRFFVFRRLEQHCLFSRHSCIFKIDADNSTSIQLKFCIIIVFKLLFIIVLVSIDFYF